MNDQIDSDRQLGTHLGFGGLGSPAFRAGHGSKQKKKHRRATIGFQTKQPMGWEINLLVQR